MVYKTLNSILLRHKAEDASMALPALITAAEHAANAVLSGEHSRKKPGSGEQFWQFRDYTSSDRPQDIDWRQSAKTDHVYIRQKEWQTAQTLHFWVHDGPGMAFCSSPHLDSKEQRAKIIALALALLATKAGEKITLLDRSITPGRTEHTLQKLAEKLCAPPSIPPAPMPESERLSLPKNSSAILIGDFLSEPNKLYQSFKTLSEQCDVSFVLHILDPAELDLPYSGRAHFIETGHEHNAALIDHTDSIRQTYQARITEHIQQVQTLCHSLHWGYECHSTDQDITQALVKIWAKMAPDNYKNEGGK